MPQDWTCMMIMHGEFPAICCESQVLHLKHNLLGPWIKPRSPTCQAAVLATTAVDIRAEVTTHADYVISTLGQV